MLTTVDRVLPADLPALLPMLRAYCDFYRVGPPDERLLALSHALIDRPGEGEQLIAREQDGSPVGFATIFWTWQTLDADRVAVLNDLFVVSAARGCGVGAMLIQRCRDRGVPKLVWQTAPDNFIAQRLYDGIGARPSIWLSYEIDSAG
jgi:GNAT superfamily N-acetyltransferase